MTYLEAARFFLEYISKSNKQFLGCKINDILLGKIQHKIDIEIDRLDDVMPGLFDDVVAIDKHDRIELDADFNDNDYEPNMEVTKEQRRYILELIKPL